MSNFIKSELGKVKVPVIVRKLKMADFSPEYKNENLRIWVNPHQDLLDEYTNIQAEIHRLKEQLNIRLYDRPLRWVNKLRFNPKRSKRLLAQIEAANERLFEWYAVIWSQHHLEDTHVTAEDVKRFAKAALDRDDAGLWKWITNQTNAMIIAYQEGLEKN